tara:strand:+ start:421 stop:612 length:192 start_codon:yes stop_codon:yes gene_type:complete
METNFDYDIVDMIKYYKYYNPKNKNNYFKKDIIDKLNYEEKEEEDIFMSNYEDKDYDFMKDLY